MNQSAAAVSSEQIVDRDREFDQTAKTDTTAADFARPMPDVIEQHNARLVKPHDPTYLHTVLQRLWTNAVGTPDYDKADWNLLVELTGGLSGELADTKKRRDELKAMVTDRDTRIQQFEKFAQNLAEKIDEIDADCIFLTGKSLDEHLADLNRERASNYQAWAEKRLCRKDLGGGMVCLLDTGHDGQCNANPQPPHVAELDVTKPCDFVRKDGSIFSFGKCQLLSGHSGPHVY